MFSDALTSRFATVLQVLQNASLMLNSRAVLQAWHFDDVPWAMVYQGPQLRLAAARHSLRAYGQSAAPTAIQSPRGKPSQTPRQQGLGTGTTIAAIGTAKAAIPAQAGAAPSMPAINGPASEGPRQWAELGQERHAGGTCMGEPRTMFGPCQQPIVPEIRQACKTHIQGMDTIQPSHARPSRDRLPCKKQGGNCPLVSLPNRTPTGCACCTCRWPGQSSTASR